MIENFLRKGPFLYRNGQGHTRGEYSKKKLCFAATDKEFLMNLLFEFSQDANCYFVKFTEKARDGMYLGRAFFVSDEIAAQQWAKYKPHPKLLCSIQDDEFVKPYRNLY